MKRITKVRSQCMDKPICGITYCYMDAYTGALGGDNKMGNFKNQIDEDIKYYQQEFRC